MRRAAATATLAGVLLTVTCAPAVRHPAITAAVAGGVIGFGACEVESISVGTCGLIGGGAAVFLGGIAALVLWLSPPSDHQILQGGSLDGEPIEGPAPTFGRKRYQPAADAGVAASIDALPAPSIAPAIPADAGVALDAVAVAADGAAAL
jgi:hypothetical protein